MSTTGVLGQNVRLFTVQIRSAGSTTPIGTGFIVSPTGIIVTCRHVLRQAGMDPDTGNFIGRRADGRATVEVYVPAVRDFGIVRPGRAYQATFKASPHPFAD